MIELKVKDLYYEDKDLRIRLAPFVSRRWFQRPRPRCPILDVGDRLYALLGEPAKRVYLHLARQHEFWTRSPFDTFLRNFELGWVIIAIGWWISLRKTFRGLPT